MPTIVCEPKMSVTGRKKFAGWPPCCEYAIGPLKITVTGFIRNERQPFAIDIHCGNIKKVGA